MPAVPPEPTARRGKGSVDRRLARAVALVLVVMVGMWLSVGGRHGRAEAREAIVLHLPMVAAGQGSPPPNLDEVYDTLTIEGEPETRPAAQHPDLNLAVRGYKAVDERRALVDYGGATDHLAPQLVGLLGRVPVIQATYRVYDWDGRMALSGLITCWPVTFITLAAERNALVRVPDSGYAISAEGHQVLVLYADTNRITLKYTREDNVIQGYTLHLENVSVAQDLLDLYRDSDSRGRRRLPALRAGQALGWAPGDTIGVAIRDVGRFMDPRSRKDWWQGY